MTLEVICSNCDWQGVIEDDPNNIASVPCVRCLVKKLKIERKPTVKKNEVCPCWKGARGSITTQRKWKEMEN